MSGLFYSACCCRWPSWVYACVSGTDLEGVLMARRGHRYCPIRLDDEHPHHAELLLPPDQPSICSVFIPALVSPRVTPSWVFSPLFPDQGWMRGLDFEVGENWG